VLKDVLQKVQEGSPDIDSIARELGIGRGTLDAVLEMAVREGYLEKASATPCCSGCPLGGMCKTESSGCEGIRMYALTSDGEKYVKEGK